LSSSVVQDAIKTAKAAGLVYVSDRTPGFRRVGTPKTFRYLDTRGHVIRNAQTVRRLQRLAIPPAWTQVWICPNPDGHLQAVGRDARGRKQYRYHPQWREARDENKYDRMIAFGKALPRIRRQVARDLRLKELTREKVLATVVRLLETTFIRVGNEEYARQNDSFGLTTLRNRHVNVRGPQVHFYFRGKSGVKHVIDIENARLAKIVKQLRDLPGYELFQYYDENGELRSVDSADVNQYLREVAQDDFTAKDFRTWAGTMLAAEALQTQTDVKAAVAQVAEQLGNTAAVCKKCYIHPSVLESYARETVSKRIRGLSPHESAVLSFLKRLPKQKPMSLEESLKKSVARHVHPPKAIR
jgi:DNA topoisomerase-1